VSTVQSSVDATVGSLGAEESAAIRHALPHAPTRLIGRASQVQRLLALLASERLITLTGPPGSGKSRLAVEVAHGALGSFADGAWFVSLAPVQDEDLIAHAVAQVLSISEQPGGSMRDIVGRYFAERELLLVLDNFEHLVDGATAVATWLAAAPRLCVLVTSRTALHLTGEHEFVVPPLGVPRDPDDPAAASSESVQLFVERASSVASDFDPDERTLSDVARICSRLDGLPLALELAAARTKALPTTAILSRLEHSLGLLTHAARDVPERHRSLHAAVSWSYGLLAPEERAAFRRLAVFRGGWGLEAADAVALASDEFRTDPLDLMSSLLDKSLIRRQSEARAEPRYDMLETLREYGRERLIEAGEAEATAGRHARWYLELADRAAPTLTGVDRGVWLDRLEQESNNFSAAMRWAISQREVELGMRLGAALWRFWQIRAHLTEGRQLLSDLLSVDADVDPAVRARAISAAGSLAYWQNDPKAAERLYTQSLQLRRSVGDPAEVASALYDLGHALSVMDAIKDSARGRALETEALEIYRSLGDPYGEAWLTWALGCNSHFSGNDARALEELTASVDRFRELNDLFGVAWGLTIGGLSAVPMGQEDLAESGWHEALRIFAAADDVSGIDSVLEHLGRLSASQGDSRRAVRLAAAASRVRGLSESAIVDVAYLGSEVGAPPDITGLSPDELEAERHAGASMSTAEAVAYALEAISSVSDAALRVHALGAMRVECRGKPIQQWGGDKAGSRQAQAIFAFLFVRGEAGIAKDEVTELIWPDLEIRRADLAFHRTLGGLRTVLEQGRDQVDCITYEGGRYRLARDVVAWTDVNAFEERLASSAGLRGREAIARLEDARRLYRGDLLDDCPIFGDSAFVEEPREYLRGRFEDLLLDLGDRYHEIGEASSAAACYRQALALDTGSTRGADRLARLGPGEDLGSD
jgi:predicted ATPase/DNA-binding SARP family transcriptional activator